MSSQDRPLLSLQEAKDKRVCRFCGLGHEEGPGLPFKLDFGREHAHQACLDKAKEERQIGQKRELPRKGSVVAVMATVLDLDRVTEGGPYVEILVGKKRMWVQLDEVAK